LIKDSLKQVQRRIKAVDRNQQVTLIQIIWTLVIQSFGNFKPVNAMHPIKILCNLLGFIRLNGTDKMPD
jgi:hypothetical protein